MTSRDKASSRMNLFQAKEAEDSGSDRCLETIDDWMLTCRHAFQLDKDPRKERKTIFVETLKPPAQVKCSSMSAGARCT